MTPFLRSLAFILLPNIEGGYVDDPADSGGATNRGITQKTYDDWRKANSLPVQPVISCTESETENIYFARYWTAAGCAALPGPVALCLFNTAVQSDPDVAKQHLGEVGPSIDALCDRMLKRFDGIIVLHPQDRKFLHGWQNRIALLRQTATAWAAEPQPLAA